MSHMGKRSCARLAAALGALCGVGLSGCASSPFVRPGSSSSPSIVNESTGRKYDDCRKAFAEATTDTVLTFSAGVFHCGPEVTVSTDWLVLRGAGMGQTFLDAAEPGGKAKAADLTAIRAAHSLRAEDLSFGGLSAVEGDDAHVTLVRVGLANNRSALIGGPGAKVEGGIIIIHSVLAGWLDQRTSQPKPIAYAGNERVALVESVLLDVEQEFERYPAPGSIVLLSSGAEGPFLKHEPMLTGPSDAGRRDNVPCGNTKNPMVFCAGQDQTPPAHEGLLTAARMLDGGKKLSKVESIFRGLGAGFADRFKALGSGIRQPDVYWFDDGYARTLQEEAAASSQKAVTVLAQNRLSTIIDRCRNNADKSIRTILDAAAALDGLLKAQTAENACKEQLKSQADALVGECKAAWDWDRVMTKISNADSALDMKGAMIQSCRKALSARLPLLNQRGPLVDAYVRGVAGQLQLEVDGDQARAADLSLVGVVGQLPAIVTKSERPSFNTSKSDILDRMIAMAQIPGAGDGRKLIETTEPCKPSGGAAAVRATTTVSLGELPPRARPTEVARTVFELPVEATRDDIPQYTSEGGINLALTKRCDELASQAYRTAVRRYVIQELSRLSQEGSEEGKLEAEAGLQLVRADNADQVVLRAHRLPVMPGILGKLSETLRVEPLEAAPIARGSRRLQVDDQQDSELPPPPEWGVADLVQAADVLAGAHVVSGAACKALLPDVPWQAEGSGVSGAVVLESVGVTVRCEPQDGKFALSLLTPKGRLPGKVLSALQNALAVKLGSSRSEKKADGMATSWDGGSGGRSGYVLRRAGKAGHPFGAILVPIGSTWAK